MHHNKSFKKFQQQQILLLFEYCFIYFKMTTYLRKIVGQNIYIIKAFCLYFPVLLNRNVLIYSSVSTAKKTKHISDNMLKCLTENPSISTSGISLYAMGWGHERECRSKIYNRTGWQYMACVGRSTILTVQYHLHGHWTMWTNWTLVN